MALSRPTSSDVAPLVGTMRRRGILHQLFAAVGTVAFLVAVVAAGYYLYAGSVFGPRPDAGKWQAVFLANGQVYFGKLSGLSRSYVTLSDIHYLQVQQALQPSAEGTPAQQPNINLIKLGNELHGPEDTMFIEKSKVLFWENLKNDSKVVEAINQSRR